MVGVVEGVQAKAWPFDVLLRQPLVNDQLGDVHLAVAFDAASRTAFVFDRRVGGRTITLTRNGERLVDETTGAAWDARSGRALDDGGAPLKPIPGIVSYAHSWRIFHPKTTFYAAK